MPWPSRHSGQAAATTPGNSITTTSPFGSFEPEICLPQLVDAAGAVFVARWTAYHVKQLERTMAKASRRCRLSKLDRSFGAT